MQLNLTEAQERIIWAIRAECLSMGADEVKELHNDLWHLSSKYVRKTDKTGMQERLIDQIDALIGSFAAEKK